MLGYVVPQKSELKLREFEIYNAYYCAVCRSVARRYGQAPRLLLSYDFVFLAMLLTSASPQDEQVREFRCLTHPTRRRNEIVRTPEIDYAADMMLLLGYYKLCDDRDDEHKLLGYAGEIFLRGAFRKIAKKMPEKARKIGDEIAALRALEIAEEHSIDRAEEPFSRLMEALLDWPGIVDMPRRDGSLLSADAWAEGLRSAYCGIGAQLGRWIYLIDAMDDLEKDSKSGSYNPLKYETPDAEKLRLVLTLYLAEIAKMYELLPVYRNAAILENIIYVGLNRKTEEILCKVSIGELNEESIRGARR